MKPEQAKALLRQSSLFSELSEENLDHLSERVVERTFDKGQTIFNQGELGDSVFVVAKGLVKVMINSPDGEEMVLTTVGPPDIFGELAVLDGGPRSAAAEALQRTTALVIDRQTLADLISQRPELEQALVRSLGKVVRRTTEHVSDLAFLHLPERVAKVLLVLADQRGSTEGDDRVIDIQLTQTDLASMVGGSRQRVNLILRSFKERGYLEFDGRRIVIKRPDLLRKRIKS
ncbi:MAG TPA: Crp/Fnr family transcriptional regulator [Actinomycetota bacterium]|nr:Crp/Fnr family transcriptional regulator [Actinomycetota bacterium]